MARCDQVNGVVRVRGRLDAVGAELVASQVEQLHLAGHRDIRVELQAESDEGGRALLAAQARRLAISGVRVTLG